MYTLRQWKIIPTYLLSRDAASARSCGVGLGSPQLLVRSGFRRAWQRLRNCFDEDRFSLPFPQGSRQAEIPLLPALKTWAIRHHLRKHKWRAKVIQNRSISGAFWKQK